MAEHARHDDLAQLRSVVTAQQEELRALRSDFARLKRRRRLPRRALPLLLAALLVALVPLATLAANPFADLNAGSPHNDNIDAIFNAGITTGCEPGARYCPNGLVTREEMASFLARAAGLGTNPPVANAAQLGGQPASAYQLAGQPIANAANAQTLQGIAPNGLLRLAQGVSVGAPVPPAVPPFGVTFNTQRSATIVAPSNGFILAIGTVTMSNGGCGASCSVFVRMRSGGATANTSSGRVATQQPEALATTAIITVNAGTNTVVFESGSDPAGAATENPNLTVLFVPFGFNGGATLTP